MVRQTFSTSWKRSVQPRKQRKYIYNAPLHIDQKQVHVHVSSELRKKYGIRAVQVRVGDKVRVLRGGFRKKEGRVERVLIKKREVYIAGVEYIKKDGSKLPRSTEPSNLMIIELDTKDPRRKKALGGRTEHQAGKDTTEMKATKKVKPVTKETAKEKTAK